MSLTQELLTFGLNNKEADVYLAALQLGFASVQELAQHAEINRTTAYTQIRNLIARGLIKVIEKQGKLYYVAESPEYLMQLQEQQEQEVARKKKLLENLLPELSSLYSLTTDKPAVRYYDYKTTDLSKLRNEIQSIKAKEMFNIFNYDRYGGYINKKHVEKILEQVSIFKVIYISKTKAVDIRVLKLLQDNKFKVKWLNSSQFGFLCEVLIANHRVYIARENDSLIITDHLLAQTLTLMFQALWGIAEDI